MPEPNPRKYADARLICPAISSISHRRKWTKVKAAWMKMKMKTNTDDYRFNQNGFQCKVSHFSSISFGHVSINFPKRPHKQGQRCLKHSWQARLTPSTPRLAHSMSTLPSSMLRLTPARPDCHQACPDWGPARLDGLPRAPPGRRAPATMFC